MKPYLSLFRARFRTLIQYRAAAVAGIGTQVFWGLIRVMILEAFYSNTNVTPPMAFAQIITYTWLGQAFFQMLPFSANPDPDVRNMIRTGSVAYELVRPLDLYGLWYSRALAARSAPTLLRCLPIFVIAVPFLGMQLPPSVASAAAFVAAMVGALLLVSAFSVLITITLLWTVAGDGIARILPSLTLIGSGMIIPIPLFPPWAQTILNLLPFKGMADAPFRLYSGHLPPGDVFPILLHQLIWTAAFVVAGRMLLTRGTRRLVVQGG
jgi:ABC-2 type transport system permease protein